MPRAKFEPGTAVRDLTMNRLGRVQADGRVLYPTLRERRLSGEYDDGIRATPHHLLKSTEANVDDNDLEKAGIPYEDLT